MPPASDWRSAHAAENLLHLDRNQFAIEFLRRNPAYREDYRRTHDEASSGTLPRESAIANLARRWGLNFPAPA
jgi:Family of unknown function (DUF6499)